MVKPTLYKGIEFVRISALPKTEQELFNKSFNRNALIKILVGDEIVQDCIQYKDYVLWYRSFILDEKTPSDLVMEDQNTALEETLESR